MIKLTLALLAVGATATHVSQSSQDEDWCYGEWTWNKCDELYYKHNYCSPVCGSYYAETADAPMNDEHWIPCDDMDWWWCWTEEECLSDWYYDHCLGLYYQMDSCSVECGDWYSYYPDGADAWFIHCMDYDCEIDFDSLEGDDCLSGWIWESCYEVYYKLDYCSDECGAYFVAEGDDDFQDPYWVTCEETESWEKYEECW